MKVLQSSFIKITLFILIIISNNYGERYLSTSTGPTYYGTYAYKGSPSIVHWSSGNVNWYLNENGAGNGFTFNETKILIENAYTVWANVSTSNFTSSYQGSTNRTNGNDGFNVHFWDNDGSVFTGGISSASAVTILTRNTNYELVDVDIAYNGAKIWYDNGYNWNDILSVAIHEIGHSFGLHHTNVSTTPLPVMAGSVPSPTPDRRVIKFDDEEGVSFLYGGNIIDNETFSGTDYYKWDIKVMTGKTLTISSGAEINFENGKYLGVYGTLNATNTTFTSTPAALTWDGIRFESNSDGTLDGCTIKEVSRNGGAITIINADPTITNCSIEYLWGQTDGIDILNCSTTKRPYLYNNTIEDGDDGVYLYNSTAYLRENDISSDYYALRLNGSMALFYAPNSSSVQGNNNIHNANYGLYLNNSVVMAGWGDGTGAHNNYFDNDNYNAYAINNSVAMARQNYWSPNPPSKIYSDGTSSVDYSQYLLFKESNSGFSYLENFYKALKLHYYEKNYFQAYEKLMYILDEYRNTEGIEKVYTELARLYYDYPEEKIINYLENEKEEKSTVGRAVILENMVNIYSAKKNETRQIEIIDEILTDYKNTIHEKNALLSKFYLYYMKGDYGKASNAIYSISDKYAEDKDVIIAKSLIEDYMSSDSEYKIEQTNSGDEVPDNFELLGNYPNPFNPMTKISFSIPQQVEVQLVVFDILGRKVAELVNESLEAGKYEINFDGSKLSSGTYIYRITAGSFTESKKMLLVK